MDLTPTEEQTALREVARDFLADVNPVHRMCELAETGWDSALWKPIAEMGWIGLSVPEDLGGASAGPVEETVLFEELGGSLLASPLFSTVALCIPLLQAAPRASELLADVVTGGRIAALAWAGPRSPQHLGAAAPLEIDGPDTRITGSRTWVLDAGHADLLVVPARTAEGTEVVVVDARAAGVVLTPLPTMDATRPAWDVRFDGVPAERILGPADAPAALAAMRRRALLLACAEAVGLSARLLAMTKDYASERQQFGRVIGTYQAVSHQVADMYVDVELGRSLVLWAALDEQGTTFPRGDAANSDAADSVVTAAASRILPAAVAVAERAIQLHGGIGMTWDSALHRYYKRALLLQALAGAPHTLRERVAATLLDR